MNVADVSASTLAWPRKNSAGLLGVAYSPDRAVIGLITAFFILRVVLALTLGLSTDKSYGIGVSRVLELSYFDHPPLSYWIVHWFIPILGDGRALRLPFIAIFSGTTWALYLLTRQLFGAAAGVWAVLALNLTGIFTFASGWVLPDGPLMLCLMAAAYTISRSLFLGPGREVPSPWRTWIAAGLWIGLACLSKYHAALFVLGLFTYLVSSRERRTVLLHPAPWAGAAVAIAVFMPVIVWKAENHWASFAFQAGRAVGYGSFPKLDQFLANLGGQVIYILPWIFVPMVIAVYEAVRRIKTADRSAYCLCLGLPAILVFTLVPLWAGRGLPHWQMPGWLMLYPLLGTHLAREAALRSRPRTWALTSTALLVGLSLLLVGYVQTGYGRLLAPALIANNNDFTLDFIEWKPLQDELRRRGLLEKEGLFVISGGPDDIGKIDQALNDSMPMQVFGESKEYAFRDDPKALVGHDALIIGRLDRMIGVDDALKPYFGSIDKLESFSFGRSGMNEIKLRMFYGHFLKKPLPSMYTQQVQ